MSSLNHHQHFSKGFLHNAGSDDVHFLFEQLLGSSPFAKADLFTVKRQVVVKSVDLNNEAYVDNPAAVEATLREIKLISRLLHPNIVRIYNVFKDPSRNCLVLEKEYCGGGTLHKAIDDQQGQLFSEQQIQSWLAQICVAIAHVHDLKIAHHNLSSENVLFSVDKKIVKVSSFGVARMKETSSTLLNRKYLAPDCDHRDLKESRYPIDVWAIGVIAYEMAALHVPSSGFANFGQQTIQDLIEKYVAPISTPLQQLISKCLLVRNWKERATMNQVTKHYFIKQEATEIIRDHNEDLREQLIELKDKAQEITSLLTGRSALSLSHPETRPEEKKYIQEMFETRSLERTQQLIDRSGADINAKNQKNYPWPPQGTALYYAVRRGDIATVCYLVESGCNVDEPDENGVPPLSVACEIGRVEIVRILLEGGANVDVVDKAGWTSLMWAGYNGHEEIIQLLLEKNPKIINHRNNQGKTALQRAVDDKYLNIVGLLKEKGATS